MNEQKHSTLYLVVALAFFVGVVLVFFLLAAPANYIISGVEFLAGISFFIRWIRK